MRRLLALGILAAATVPAGARADDAPLKPMRTLVYQVQWSSHSAHEKKTSGLNSAYGNPGALPGVASGSGTATVVMDVTEAGTLTVDVLAAPGDQLVVETAFNGKATRQPKVRVGLYADGRLAASTGASLGPEALHLLPLLARGFIANRDVSPGSFWSIDAVPPAKGTTTYRVSSNDGDRATIAVESAISVPGISGFDQTERGTTTYATDLLAPVKYDVNGRVRRQLGVDELVVTDTHMTIALVSDSFAKK